MAVSNIGDGYHSAVVLIPVFTGLISFLSSLALLTSIIRKIRREKKSAVREHLLLGLSFLDCCGSFGLMFSTFPAPRQVPTYYKNLGNLKTCAAQGFFVQLGLSVPLYNTALCLYYLLVVRYRVSQATLTKWLIPVSHSLILTFALTTAVTGLVTDSYNPAGALGCWIEDPRHFCNETDIMCDRGEKAILLTKLFGLIHVSASFAIIIVSMTLLYCTVRKTAGRSNRWDFQQRFLRQRSTQQQQQSDQDLSGRSATSARSIHSTATTTTSSRNFVVQQTMETGFMYSFAFLAVYAPTAFLSFSTLDRGSTPYKVVSVLNVIFLPLQGFFNLLIYTAPTWRPWVRKKLNSVRQFVVSSSSSSSHREGRSGNGANLNQNDCNGIPAQENKDQVTPLRSAIQPQRAPSTAPSTGEFQSVPSMGEFRSSPSTSESRKSTPTPSRSMRASQSTNQDFHDLRSSLKQVSLLFGTFSQEERDQNKSSPPPSSSNGDDLFSISETKKQVSFTSDGMEETTNVGS